MSPQEAIDASKERVIHLSGKTVVAAPVSAVLVGAMVLLGIRFIPGVFPQERDNGLLIHKMDTMLLNQSGMAKTIHNLELDGAKMSGRLDNVEGDVRELKDAINRVAPWPGEDYP